MSNLRRALLVSSASSGGGDKNYVEIAGIKWAKWNVGATGETDYGYFFQWADSKGYTAAQVGSGSGKKYFGWSDYKYGNGGSSDSSMTKYNSTDKKMVLDEIDDAAYVASGNTWRMPTDEEYIALGNSVTTAWTSSYEGSGIAGLVCTAKADSSKKLFFPAAGYANNGSYANRSSYGYYWSSNVYSSSVHFAHLAIIRSSNPTFSTYGSRCQGFSIRGIYVQPIPLESLTISGDTEVTNEATYTVNYNPIDTTETGVTWSIVSGSEYAEINENTGKLTVLGGASGSTVVIRATSVVNSGITDEMTLSVTYVELPVVKFTAKQANSTIGLSKKSSNQTLEYSTDGDTWNSMTTSTTITLANLGDSVYIRGILNSNNTTSNYTQFTMSGNIKVSGNINYLWNKDNPDTALKDYCGYYLFNGCTALTEITGLTLPSTSIPYRAYDSMFMGCTNITTLNGLVLPGTTLSTYAYNHMFDSCTSIVDGRVDFKVRNLPEGAFSNTFKNCTSLTIAPELAATSLGDWCYQYLFYGCTNLTTAPELPATTLKRGCYHQMFDSCTKLNYIKCLATDKSAQYCTQMWVNGVSSTGTFVKDASMTGWTTGTSGIPTGWVVEDYVPLQSISISGETNVKNSATYTVSYTPSDTTETGVTWSIVSGSEYATIDSSTGVLTALDGASSSTVAIRAISTNNTSITAEKSISVTYVSETLFDDAVLHVPFKENQSVTDVNSGILPSKNTGEITSNGYYTNGTSGICLEYTDSRLFSAFDNDFTMYFEVTPYNLNRNQYLFQIKIEYYFIGLFIYYSVNNRFSVTLSNDTWNPTYYDDEIPNSPIVNYGTTYKICFKGGKNSYLDVFINGVKYTINRTYTSHSPFTVFRIGGNWNASRFSKTDFIDFAVWNKKLTDDECVDLTK